MSEYLVTQIKATSNIVIRLNTRVVDGRGEHRLEALVVEDGSTGRREEVAAAAVFVLIGAEPRTDWLADVLQRDDRGFILTGHDVDASAWAPLRPPLPFETSLPGVFAVGDVRHGPSNAWPKRRARARWRSVQSTDILLSCSRNRPVSEISQDISSQAAGSQTGAWRSG